MIETSARGMVGQGPGETPTPEEVYANLGVEPCCRGCFPLATRVISETLASAGSYSGSPDGAPIVAAE
jgi:hypothetical protein